MTSLPHLAQRLLNVPLAITPQKLELVVAAVADRMGIAQLTSIDGRVLAFDGGELIEDRGDRARDMGYDVVAGVAVIPVTGTLVAKLGSLRPYSGMTGYDGLRACFAMAMEDPDVRAVVFDIESPGGEVSGLFSLVDRIFAGRGAKPVWSILSEHAYSAAYAIASATDRIIVPRTGGTGSVGVICAFVDMSRALRDAGISVEVLTFGARKADGSEFSPLSKEARARFQRDIDAMGTLFCETVARNRKIPVARVLDTEAGTFMGADGIEVGFADAVMDPSDALAELVDSLD